MKPCRNKITFTGPLTDKTVALCNSVLSAYLRTHQEQFLEGHTYTFYSGENGINPDRVVESVCGYSISRWPHTFHQNDDTIRKALYSLLITHIPSYHERSLFLGGECYVFPKLFMSFYTDIMTDTASIADDARLNHPYATVHCLPYPEIRLSHRYDLCIVNVNKHGLPEQLLEQIHSSDLYLIYCHDKTHQRDVDVCTRRYDLMNQWRIGNELYHILVSRVKMKSC